PGELLGVLLGRAPADGLPAGDAAPQGSGRRTAVSRRVEPRITRIARITTSCLDSCDSCDSWLRFFRNRIEAREMSRTTLCLLTAGTLAALSLGMMLLRYLALGGAVPAGPGAWRVTLRVHGQAEADAKLMTAMPLDFGRQHIVREQCHSPQLSDKPP